MQTWLVTGGAGFIGSCFVRQAIEHESVRIVNLDKLTYAGHLENIPSTPKDRYEFVHCGIEDRAQVAMVFEKYQPDAVLNFAAESHVDRSIDGPSAFLQTNVVGTVNLLDETLSYFRNLPLARRSLFRFLHVSTDEVYGSLGATGLFTETSPYQPNSPYAASKASSDLFARSYHETYGLPILLTNCSNNYGPYQFPEKLIPLMILNALEGRELPVYGDGGNVRDWLYVDDHCRALRLVLQHGKVGATYNIGGDSERTNIEVVQTICCLVDELSNSAKATKDLIRFVQDRPGHDRRYAVDTTKIKSELGWKPTVSFDEGIRNTVSWFLNNPDWVLSVAGDERQRMGAGGFK